MYVVSKLIQHIQNNIWSLKVQVTCIFFKNSSQISQAHSQLKRIVRARNYGQWHIYNSCLLLWCVRMCTYILINRELDYRPWRSSLYQYVLVLACAKLVDMDWISFYFMLGPMPTKYTKLIYTCNYVYNIIQNLITIKIR